MKLDTLFRKERICINAYTSIICKMKDNRIIVDMKVKKAMIC